MRKGKGKLKITLGNGKAKMATQRENSTRNGREREERKTGMWYREIEMLEKGNRKR